MHGLGERCQPVALTAVLTALWWDPPVLHALLSGGSFAGQAASSGGTSWPATRQHAHVTYRLCDISDCL